MKLSDTLFIVLVTTLTLLSTLHIIYVAADDPTSVDTRVNVTNAYPIIQNITINTGQDINLTEGSTYSVLCNASILEYNGLSDLVKINGTFFRGNESRDGIADNDTRYFNTSCMDNGTIDASEYSYWFACTFEVLYYAYNGTWNCTIFAEDTLIDEINKSAEADIVPLFAMNVTDLIDYGNLAVGDTSTTQQANVTNWGNQGINLTVYGYGGDDNATGANLSFVCPLGDNISIGWERFSLLDSHTWDQMVSLNSSDSLVENLTLDKRYDPGIDSMNTTYWSLQVPPNPFGVCNGTVVFTAIAP